MTSSAEKVQYEIEVLTKGREELQQLRDDLKELLTLGGQTIAPPVVQPPTPPTITSPVVQPPTRQTYRQWEAKQAEARTEGGAFPEEEDVEAGEENAKAMEEEGEASQLLGMRMSKLPGPLREVGRLTQLLNPATLAASLGLGVLGAGVMSFVRSTEQEVASLASVAGAMNQYTTETYTMWEFFQKLSEESDQLKVPLSDLMEAYKLLTPAVRDAGVEMGIINRAVEIHKRTGIPLADVVRELTAAYSEGIPVMDEAGGKLKIGMEAVEAKTAAMLQAGNDFVAVNTEIDDRFRKSIEENGRLLGIALTGVATLVKLAYVELFGDSIIGPIVNDWINNVASGIESGFKDFWEGKKGIAVMLDDDEEMLIGGKEGFKDKLMRWFKTAWDHVFSWDWIKASLKFIFIQVPGAIWDFIKEKWEDSFAQKWWDKIAEIFSWTTIKGYIDKALEFVQKTIWDDNLKVAIDAVHEFFKTAWDELYGLIIDPIERAVDWSKNKLRELSELAHDWSGGLIGSENVSPPGQLNAPRDAEGGIVTKPRLSVTGEDGPEAIIPLSRLESMIGGGGGGGPREINLYIDGRKFERFVIDRLDRNVRVRGGR